MEETKVLQKTKEEKKKLQEIQRQERKKRHKRNVKTFSACLVTGTALGVSSFYRKKKSKMMETQNDISSEKYYDAFFEAKKIELTGEDIEKITVRACFGAILLKLNIDQPKEIVIELESIMSGVLIQVPEHVQFYMEQKGVMTKTANQVQGSDNEDTPTVYVEVKGICSGICVRSIPLENK